MLMSLHSLNRCQSKPCKTTNWLPNTWKEFRNSIIWMLRNATFIINGLGRFYIVSISSRYREQNVTTSCEIYPSAIHPSGRALLRTHDFNSPKYLWNQVVNIYMSYICCYYQIPRKSEEPLVTFLLDTFNDNGQDLQA